MKTLYKLLIPFALFFLLVLSSFKVAHISGELKQGSSNFKINNTSPKMNIDKGIAKEKWQEIASPSQVITFSVGEDIKDGDTSQFLKSSKHPDTSWSFLRDGKIFVSSTWDIKASEIVYLSGDAGRLIVNYFTYEITDILWKAGEGDWHPWYRTVAPFGNTQAGRGFRYPFGAKHSIVFENGGLYWNLHGSTNGYIPGTNSCTGILVCVNDDKYDDNQGGFKLTLTSSGCEYRP